MGQDPVLLTANERSNRISRDDREAGTRRARGAEVTQRSSAKRTTAGAHVRDRLRRQLRLEAVCPAGDVGGRHFDDAEGAVMRDDVPGGQLALVVLTRSVVDAVDG